MREQDESIMKEVAFLWVLKILLNPRNNEIGKERDQENEIIDTRATVW